MNDNKYSVVMQWHDEDEAWIATSPEFPGLVGEDPDEDKARAELREAIEMALEHFAETTRVKARSRTPPTP